jgi:hypothetical protein
MKMIMFSLALFISNLFAASHDYSHLKVSDVKVKDIRNWLRETGEPNTCVDEYFKRRKQLTIKLGLTPFVIPGSTIAGLVGGAYGGVGIFRLSGLPRGNYADLAALAIGAMFGTVGGFGTGLTQEVSALINFFRNQDLLKVIFESRNEEGESLNNFFINFRRHYPESSISRDKFKEEILHMDESGKLCDGSIVNPRRSKNGSKLKQRLATKKEIFKSIFDTN